MPASGLSNRVTQGLRGAAARAKAAVAARRAAAPGINGAPAPGIDKWVTFLGSEYVAAGNVALSIASVATYSVARGSTITAGESIYNFGWLAIYSAIVFFAKSVTSLQKLPIVVFLFEIYLALWIGRYLTMGWADKAAAEKVNITDNLKTEADSTRCLSDTGTCAKEKCIKEAGSTVSGSTRKGEITNCV